MQTPSIEYNIGIRMLSLLTIQLIERSIGALNRG